MQNPSALLLQQQSVMEDVKGRVWPGGPLGARVATHMEGAAGTSGGYPFWPEHNIGVQAPTLSTWPCVSWCQWPWQARDLPQTQPSWGGAGSFSGRGPYLVLRQSARCP